MRLYTVRYLFLEPVGMKGINKSFKNTLVILITVFGIIVLWNIVRHFLIEHALASQAKVAAVSTTIAKSEHWQPYLEAVGTLSAINGVQVSTQGAGNVISINFQSGQLVKKGDLLVIIDDRVEQAELQNNLASLKLAQITYERNKTLAGSGAVSKQAFDEATAKYQQAQAAVAQTQAAIAYKNVTAPFDGKLGINNINLGQYLKPGDPIVALQSMDPLYVNFYLPEQVLHQLYINQVVQISVDAVPHQVFSGRIHALNSLVDTQTHNISVQAVVPNPSQKLYPGLFSRIKILLPAKQNVVTVPQTSINYTLYGNTVYVITKDAEAGLIATLKTVQTGDERDGKIIILRGLKAGEQVVSSGQLKLTNGQRVIINNTVK